MEERFDIDTPEGVVFGYRVAGIGSRFIAALVDTIILVLTLLSFFCGLGVLSGITYGSGLEGWLVALTVLFIFVLLWGYYIFFELVWNGQSPGKRMVGLRVVQTDGTPITLVDSLIRNLVRVVDFLPLYYALGLVVMFFNVQSRRLGDFAAGTLVVKEQKGVTLESVQQALSVTDAATDASVSFALGPGDRRLINDFLARRHELENRERLARQIASAVAAKLELPTPSSAREAEALLIRIARQSKS